MTLRIKEECDLHTDPENRLERTLDFDGGGWEVRVSDCGDADQWDYTDRQ